jgi:hypothetical protein
VNAPRNFWTRFLRNLHVYITSVLACLATYFVYVMMTRGVSGAFSAENLKWFGMTLLYTSALAGLVAALQGLADGD